MFRDERELCNECDGYINRSSIEKQPMAWGLLMLLLGLFIGVLIGASIMGWH